jgi:hypothetical protein
VLISGGTDGNGTVLAAAELYDPSNSTFTPTNNLITGWYSHTVCFCRKRRAVLLAGHAGSGRVARPFGSFANGGMCTRHSETTTSSRSFPSCLGSER